MADSVASSADDFAGAEAVRRESPPHGMRPQDAAAMITAATKDIMGALGAAGQAVASGVGALGSAGVSGLGAAANAAAQVGSVMVATGAKLATGDASGATHPSAGALAGTQSGGATAAPLGGDRHPDPPVRTAAAPSAETVVGHSKKHSVAYAAGTAGPAQIVPLGAPAGAQRSTYSSRLVGKKLFNDYRDDGSPESHPAVIDGTGVVAIAFTRPTEEASHEHPLA